MQNIDPIMAGLQNSLPRFNAEICDGLAYTQVKNAEQYADELMRDMSHGLPEGVEYIGYTQCTPLEQFQEQSNLPSRKKQFDIAPSDVYMVKYIFKFNGQRYIKPMLLPIVSRGGIIKLRGASHMISPVMIDNLFSVEDEGIFVQLTRNRINFYAVQVSYMASGVEQNTKTTYSHLFNLKTAAEASVKRKPTMANYLFAYHGLTEAFAVYCKAKVHYGTHDINEDSFPADKWTICYSNGNSFTRNDSRTRTGIRLAVPRTLFENDDTLKSMVGGLFYILDHISDLGFVSVDALDNPMFWKRALIRFTWKNVDSETKCIELMDKHLKSIENYVDSLVRRSLEYENIPVVDMRQLMFYMIQNFERMCIDTDVANTNNKYLATTRYVMFDITCALFKMMYNTERLKGTRLTQDGLEKALRGFPIDKILSMGSGNGWISSLDCATDLMLAKVTTPVVSQTKATGKSGGNKAAEMKDKSLQLDPSVININSYSAITKSAPHGRGRLNIFAHLSPEYKVSVNPVNKPLYSNLKMLLDRTESK